jgi:hypothetical protein
VAIPKPFADRLTLKVPSLHISPSGVPEDQIIGIRYGLRGFYDKFAKPVPLTRRTVDGIHLKGGTMLVGAGLGFSTGSKLLEGCGGCA